MTATVEIREATLSDKEAIWEIFREVIATGDTYVFDPKTPKEGFEKYWFGKGMHTYVSVSEGKVTGSYILKPNQPGLGDHIANGSYMVHPGYRSQGMGFKLGEHSINEARRLGFYAIQFNIVIATNGPAVRLWQRLGFRIVGELPDVFRHRTLGFVNAYIMYLKL